MSLSGWAERAVDGFMDRYGALAIMAFAAATAGAFVLMILGVIFGGGGPACAPGAHRARVQSREQITAMVGKVPTPHVVLRDRVVCIEDETGR